MRLNGQLHPAAEISAALRLEMFRLMERYYENVALPVFLADLEQKQWVILLSDPTSGQVCGFSTQVLMHTQVDGRPIGALFSGDTIIDHEHRGDIALAHVWGRLAQALIDQHQAGELYWFLISKGYKTYRFLPLFFREFYPRCQTETPAKAARIIAALARQRFGQAFDPVAGIIRATPGKDRLRPGVADLTQQRLRDPQVRFFAQRNPGWIHGEELCCLAPLNNDNWTAAARRALAAQPLGAQA